MTTRHSNGVGSIQAPCYDAPLFAKLPHGKKRVMVASLWDSNDLLEEIDRLLLAGFTSIQMRITPRPDGGGRCLRSKMFQRPDGKWEVCYLEADIKVIAEALQREQT